MSSDDFVSLRRSPEEVEAGAEPPALSADGPLPSPAADLEVEPVDRVKAHVPALAAIDVLLVSDLAAAELRSSER